MLFFSSIHKLTKNPRSKMADTDFTIVWTCKEKISIHTPCQIVDSWMECLSNDEEGVFFSSFPDADVWVSTTCCEVTRASKFAFQSFFLQHWVKPSYVDGLFMTFQMAFYFPIVSSDQGWCVHATNKTRSSSYDVPVLRPIESCILTLSLV